MEILRDTNIDFMKYRKVWIWVSLLLVGIGAASIFAPVKLNQGIDFKGGTQIILKFQDVPDVDQLRKLAESTGAKVAVSMPSSRMNFFSMKRSCRRSRALALGRTSRPQQRR